MKRLSEAELEIMMAIWNLGKTATSSEITDMLGDKTWKKTSVLTFLSRLVEKGYLVCKKEGKVNYYTPLVSYEKFTRKESKNVLEKIYHNSLKNFVSALYEGDELKKDEIEELKMYLEQL